MRFAENELKALCQFASAKGVYRGERSTSLGFSGPLMTVGTAAEAEEAAIPLPRSTKATSEYLKGRLDME
jgi:hypothetical protein